MANFNSQENVHHDVRGTRVKPVLQSRINMLHKTLVFKTAAKAFGGIGLQSRQLSPSIPMLTNGDVECGDSSVFKFTTSLASRKRKVFKTLHNTGHQDCRFSNGPVSTLFGRNVRQEIEQHKFDGLARLFAKTKKPFVRVSKAKSDAPLEVNSQPGDALFARPQLPRDSRRLPSRWATKEEDFILPSRNKNFREIVATGDILLQDEKVVDVINRLIDNWKQENVIRLKTSFILRAFYMKTATGTKRDSLAQYDKEIASANKCLLVATFKQSIIEKQIKQIQLQNLLPGAVPKSKSGQGCLAFSKITLPLRVQFSNTFVFCLIRHQDQVIVSEMLNSFIGRRHAQPNLQFNFDEQFENLEPNFQVVVQLYLMSLNSGNHAADFDVSLHRMIYNQLKKKMKHNQLTKFIKKVIVDKKIKSRDKLCQNTNLLPSKSIVNFLNLGHANQGSVQVVGSAFKSFGSITVDRSNCTSARLAIDQFDYTMSPSQNHALLNLELSINYGNRKEFGDDHLFGVHVESRTLDMNHIAPKQLHFSRFKFSKGSVAIDGKWLKVRTKRSSHKLDLGHCLNSVNFGQATVGNLLNTICLLFTESIDHSADPYPELNLGDQPSSHYQFLFLTLHKPELLMQFYNRTMGRVATVRQWQAPVPLKDDNLPSVMVSQAKQQDDIDQQCQVARVAALLANLQVI